MISFIFLVFSEKLKNDLGHHCVDRQLSCSIKFVQLRCCRKDSRSVGTLACRHLLLKMPAGADSQQVLFCFSGSVFFSFDISCACGINKRATAVTVRCFARRLEGGVWKGRWGLFTVQPHTSDMQKISSYCFLCVVDTLCNKPCEKKLHWEPNLPLQNKGLTTSELCNVRNAHFSF